MRKKKSANSKIMNSCKEWVVPIVIALLVVVFINKTLFFNIEVPTLSMYPTIKANDRIFVTRVHNTDKLKRGDIVVFHSNKDEKELIKRLIGLPGDSVEYNEEGELLINGKIIEERYVLNHGGKTGVFKVPEGQFFFLGDNRINSEDARYWDNPFIVANDIMGKARMVIFPIDRIGDVK